jgi:glycosyltransferase involved in cell wall biosynthesis
VSIKVSIVIPVYNGQKYLQKCLKSCEEQTLKDIEIIAVDDGSTDSCPQILQTFQTENKNLKIITQENKGPSIARQTGIKNANGKYISFLDNDDWLAPDFCEVMYNFAEKNNCEIVLSAHKIYKNNKFYHDNTPHFMTNDSDVFVVKDHKNLANYSYITNTIIKKDLLNNIIFPNSKIGEDYAIFSQCAMQAERVGYTKYTFYAIVDKKGSLCTTHFDDYSLGFFENIKTIETFLSQNSHLQETFKDNFEIKRLRFLLRILGTIKKSEYKKEFFKKFQQELKSFDKKYIQTLKFRKRYLLSLIQKGHYNTYVLLADFYKPIKDLLNKLRR